MALGVSLMVKSIWEMSMMDIVWSLLFITTEDDGVPFHDRVSL
jgi:hypothetical protein